MAMAMTMAFLSTGSSSFDKRGVEGWYEGEGEATAEVGGRSTFFIYYYHQSASIM
jgi:hypothetical protein